MFTHSQSSHTQVVTVDMMESLIGYEIPVKFLEVDEVRLLCVFTHNNTVETEEQSRQRAV